MNSITKSSDIYYYGLFAIEVWWLAFSFAEKDRTDNSTDGMKQNKHVKSEQKNFNIWIKSKIHILNEMEFSSRKYYFSCDIFTI